MYQAGRFNLILFFVYQIDDLQQIKQRAALLEREKESLNFVVENKVHFER
jgi:hypothetical protein